MENHIQTISTSLTSLLTELAHVSAAQTAQLAASNHEVLNQLQEISSEIGHLRSHLTAKGPGHSRSSSEDSQQEIIENTDLESLMEVDCFGHLGACALEPATAEEYNQLARRYNSNTQYTHDILMPLHNRRNKCVLGFPAMLGALVSLDNTSKELLCGALGIPDPGGDFGFAASCCGCDSRAIENLNCFGPTADMIASNRMLTRHQRALDLAAHALTADTRRSAERHNRAMRKHNVAGNGIKPLVDKRGLVVPGFPTDFEWFFVAPKQDVLWLLGEYGQDTAEDGCLERFKDFVGVPQEIERGGEVEWLL